MFSFFSIPNEGEFSINGPKISQPKEESSSLQDSLPWNVTGETPLEWAKYELIEKRDDLEEGFNNITKKIQQNLPSFGDLGGSLPPNTCGETPEVKSMPQISPSTEESILPWRRYNETFFEWAEMEVSIKLDDLGVTDKIEKIKQETTSFLSCGAPRK